VHIEVAKRRQIDHPLWNDATIADHDDCVGLEANEPGTKFIVVLNALWLRDWQIKRESGLLHRGWSKRKAASARLVRLCNHQTNRETGVNQRLERRNRKARRAAEDKRTHWVIL
jgi:hypothetical protein